MLRIDRVRAEMDVLPGTDPAHPTEGLEEPSTKPEGGLGDREHIRDIVLEVLRDHFRQLERRGLL